MVVALPPEVLAAHPEWDHQINGTTGPSYAPPPPATPGVNDQYGSMVGGTNAYANSFGYPVPAAPRAPAAPAGAPGANAAPWYDQLPPGSVGGFNAVYPGIGTPSSPYYGSATPQSDYGLPTIAPADQFGYPNPALLEWNAQNQLRGAQNQRNLAEQNYLNLQESQLQPADAAVLAARRNQLSAQGSYLDEQNRFLNQQQQETMAVQAAKMNVSDLQNVARGQRLQEGQTYRYRLAGLNAPIEVTMPPGYNGPMPLGTVAKIQTLAQQLETIYGNADALEKFRVEAARIHSEQVGQEVTAADIARGSVQLTLQEAQLAVQRAGLTETQAQQGVTWARQPPAPGLVPYTNPEDGSFQWVTEPQLQELQRVDSRNRTLQTYAEMGIGGLSRTQLETMASEVNADGTPVMPESQLVGYLQQQGWDQSAIQQFLDQVHYRQQARAQNPFGSSFGSSQQAPTSTIPYTPPSGG